jgi:hypothetical protein
MKSIVLAVTLLCAAGAAAAQTAATAETLGALPTSKESQAFRAVAAAQNIDHLAMLLDLNEGQKAQVKAILDDGRAKMEEFAQEAKASGQSSNIEQMQANLVQVQKEAHEQLSGVLTDTQLKKFDAVGQHALSTGLSTGLSLQTKSAGASCDSSGRCTRR